MSLCKGSIGNILSLIFVGSFLSTGYGNEPTSSFNTPEDSLKAPPVQIEPRLSATRDLLVQGESLYMEGHIERALEMLKIAAQSFEELKSAADLALALSDIGVVYYQERSVDSSLYYLRKAQTVQEKNNLINGLIGTYFSLFSVLAAKDNENERWEYLNRVRSLLTNEQLAESLFSLYHPLMLHGYCEMYSNEGKYDSALIYCDSATFLMQPMKDNPNVVYPMSFLGLVWNAKGDHTKALAYYSKVYEIGTKSEDSNFPIFREAVAALSNIASTYTKMKMYEQSINFLQKAIREQLKHREFEDDLAYSYNSLGLIYSKIGKRDSALSYYEKARTIFETLELKSAQVLVLCNIAMVQMTANNQELAVSFLDQAKKLCSQGCAAGVIATVWNNLGLCCQLKGNSDSALICYQEGLALLGPMPVPSDEVPFPNPDFKKLIFPADAQVLLNHKANLLFSLYQGRPSDQRFLVASYEAYKTSINITESLYVDIESEKAKQTFLAERVDEYREIIPLLLDMDKVYQPSTFKAEAFEYAEKTKARSLLDLLSQMDLALEDVKSDSLKNRLYKLRIQLNKAENMMYREETYGKKDKLIDAWTYFQNEYSLTLDQLRKCAPIFGELMLPDIASVEFVQRKVLDQNEVILEYVLGRNKSYLFVIGKSMFDIVSIENGDVVAEKVHRLLRLCTDRNELESHYESFVNLSYDLYKAIIMPAKGVIHGRDLIIIPDGVLNYFPFEMLVSNRPTRDSGEAPHYLIFDNTISYCQSASVLAKINEKRLLSSPGKTGFVGFADPDLGKLLFPDTLKLWLSSLDFQVGASHPILNPLPLTRTEVEEIANLFPDEGNRLYFGKSASEDSLKSNSVAKRSRYLHIATHGFYNEGNPLFSGLVLSQSGKSKENGYLDVQDVLELRNAGLKPDIVVLSACETALGEYVNGEGLIGLTRAFSYMGAPSVVASLWKVSNRTTVDLMVDFYRGLQKGKSKANALREAKLKMLKSERFAYRSPYYWAAFVLIGSPK